MLHKSLFAATLALLLSACSMIDGRGAGSHNLSRGSCENITVCAAGQSDCRTRQDTMTQNHCQMVGGTFIPAKQSSGRF